MKETTNNKNRYENDTFYLFRSMLEIRILMFLELQFFIDGKLLNQFLKKNEKHY